MQRRRSSFNSTHSEHVATPMPPPPPPAMPQPPEEGAMCSVAALAAVDSDEQERLRLRVAELEQRLRFRRSRSNSTHWEHNAVALPPMQEQEFLQRRRSSGGSSHLQHAATPPPPAPTLRQQPEEGGTATWQGSGGSALTLAAVESAELERLRLRVAELEQQEAPDQNGTAPSSSLACKSFRKAGPLEAHEPAKPTCSAYPFSFVPSSAPYDPTDGSIGAPQHPCDGGIGKPLTTLATPPLSLLFSPLESPLGSPFSALPCAAAVGCLAAAGSAAIQCDGPSRDTSLDVGFLRQINRVGEELVRFAGQAKRRFVRAGRPRRVDREPDDCRAHSTPASNKNRVRGYSPPPMPTVEEDAFELDIPSPTSYAVDPCGHDNARQVHLACVSFDGAEESGKFVSSLQRSSSVPSGRGRRACGTPASSPASWTHMSPIARGSHSYAASQRVLPPPRLALSAEPAMASVVSQDAACTAAFAAPGTIREYRTQAAVVTAVELGLALTQRAPPGSIRRVAPLAAELLLQPSHVLTLPPPTLDYEEQPRPQRGMRAPLAPGPQRYGGEDAHEGGYNLRDQDGHGGVDRYRDADNVRSWRGKHAQTDDHRERRRDRAAAAYGAGDYPTWRPRRLVRVVDPSASLPVASRQRPSVTGGQRKLKHVQAYAEPPGALSSDTATVSSEDPRAGGRRLRLRVPFSRGAREAAPHGSHRGLMKEEQDVVVRARSEPSLRRRSRYAPEHVGGGAVPSSSTSAHLGDASSIDMVEGGLQVGVDVAATAKKPVDALWGANGPELVGTEKPRAPAAIPSTTTLSRGRSSASSEARVAASSSRITALSPPAVQLGQAASPDALERTLMPPAGPELSTHAAAVAPDMENDSAKAMATGSAPPPSVLTTPRTIQRRNPPPRILPKARQAAARTVAAQANASSASPEGTAKRLGAVVAARLQDQPVARSRESAVATHPALGSTSPPPPPPWGNNDWETRGDRSDDDNDWMSPGSPLAGEPPDGLFVAPSGNASRVLWSPGRASRATGDADGGGGGYAAKATPRPPLRRAQTLPGRAQHGATDAASAAKAAARRRSSASGSAEASVREMPAAPSPPWGTQTDATVTKGGRRQSTSSSSGAPASMRAMVSEPAPKALGLTPPLTPLGDGTLVEDEAEVNRRRDADLHLYWGAISRDKGRREPLGQVPPKEAPAFGGDTCGAAKSFRGTSRGSRASGSLARAGSILWREPAASQAPPPVSAAGAADVGGAIVAAAADGSRRSLERLSLSSTASGALRRLVRGDRGGSGMLKPLRRGSGESRGGGDDFDPFAGDDDQDRAPPVPWTPGGVSPRSAAAPAMSSRSGSSAPVGDDDGLDKTVSFEMKPLGLEFASSTKSPKGGGGGGENPSAMAVGGIHAGGVAEALGVEVGWLLVAIDGEEVSALSRQDMARHLSDRVDTLPTHAAAQASAVSVSSLFSSSGRGDEAGERAGAEASEARAEATLASAPLGVLVDTAVKATIKAVAPPEAEVAAEAAAAPKAASSTAAATAAARAASGLEEEAESSQEGESDEEESGEEDVAEESVSAHSTAASPSPPRGGAHQHEAPRAPEARPAADEGGASNSEEEDEDESGESESTGLSETDSGGGA